MSGRLGHGDEKVGGSRARLPKEPDRRRRIEGDAQRQVEGEGDGQRRRHEDAGVRLGRREPHGGGDGDIGCRAGKDGEQGRVSDAEPGEPRAKVLARMQAAMTQSLDELWQGRAATSAVKTPEEAIILASIVEKETGKASERRMVAGVYSNRLRQGMKLDADPTVVYPVTKGRPLGRRIRRSELNADTGYNTYLKPGLPAGPIANPGRASIAAVLDPAATDALFFVADGSGGHVFAATLAEHNANVAKWYALRRQKGEM